MKTIFYLLLFIAIGGGIFYFLDEGMLSEEEKIIREKTLEFIEAVKFKDFNKAATFHSLKDANRKNIPGMIERKFHIKPEFLNFVDYEAGYVEMNSAEDRGRVKANITIELLNTKHAQKDKGNKVKTIEMIFYWFKEPVYELAENSKLKKVEGKYEWYHKLESSL